MFTNDYLYSELVRLQEAADIPAMYELLGKHPITKRGDNKGSLLHHIQEHLHRLNASGTRWFQDFALANRVCCHVYAAALPDLERDPMVELSDGSSINFITWAREDSMFWDVVHDWETVNNTPPRLLQVIANACYDRRGDSIDPIIFRLIKLGYGFEHLHEVVQNAGADVLARSEFFGSCFNEVPASAVQVLLDQGFDPAQMHVIPYGVDKDQLDQFCQMLGVDRKQGLQMTFAAALLVNQHLEAIAAFIYALKDVNAPWVIVGQRHIGLAEILSRALETLFMEALCTRWICKRSSRPWMPSTTEITPNKP